MAAIRPGRPAAKKAAGAPQPTADVAAPPPPPAAPKGRSLTVPAIVVAIALLGAAYLMSSGGKSNKSPVQAQTTASTAAPASEGDVVTLDPITMNLASGDIVKVGIALQLPSPTGSSLSKKATADPKNFGARALDELIAVLGDYSRDELAKQGGLADAKAKLTKRLQLVYHGDVVGVYFTQFVIA